MIYTTHYDSPIGKILLAAKNEQLIGLWFEDQKYYLTCFQEEVKEEIQGVLVQTKEWLDRYFNKEVSIASELPISLRGSNFKVAVLKKLLEIPYGKTTTYKALADEIAYEFGLKKMSAQAIGGSIKHNPLLIIIPCHRVIGTSGKLTGYAGGLERKKYLLELEDINDVNNSL